LRLSVEIICYDIFLKTPGVEGGGDDELQQS